MAQVGVASSGQLLAEMRSHHAVGATRAPLELAASAWHARLNGVSYPGDDLAELGEVWRLAMLAASRPDPDTGESGQPQRFVWRARAMAAFALSGCRNGTTMLCLPIFFDAARDVGTSPSQAVAILDVMLALADDGEPVPRTEILSTCEEKRGWLLALQAESTPSEELVQRQRLFDDAALAYERALTAEVTPRRRAKIEAGLHSVRYLRSGDDAGRNEAAAALRVLLVPCPRTFVGSRPPLEALRLF